MIKGRRTYSEDERRRILEQQGGVCASCGEPATVNNTETDHILPNSAGGPTTVWNGQVLHIKCHKRKTENDAGVYDGRKRRHLSWEQNKKDMSVSKDFGVFDLNNMGFGNLGMSENSKHSTRRKRNDDLGFNVDDIGGFSSKPIKKKNRKNDPYGLGDFSI